MRADPPLRGSVPLKTPAVMTPPLHALGKAADSNAGRALVGTLIRNGGRSQALHGHLVGGTLMLVATLAEARRGIAAERRPLEDTAAPLSSFC